MWSTSYDIAQLWIDKQERSRQLYLRFHLWKFDIAISPLLMRF